MHRANGSTRGLPGHHSCPSVVTAFDIREEVESPEELEECVRFIHPVEWLSVDDSTTTPAKQATRVTEKDNGEGKNPKSETMELGSIGDQWQLAHNFWA
jgi:hypothetical protein